MTICSLVFFALIYKIAGAAQQPVPPAGAAATPGQNAQPQDPTAPPQQNGAQENAQAQNPHNIFGGAGAAGIRPQFPFMYAPPPPGQFFRPPMQNRSSSGDSASGTSSFPFAIPPMPYIPLGEKETLMHVIKTLQSCIFTLAVPPPPPLLQTTGLTDEELRRMEGTARENIEARLRCLRNVQILLDSAVVQMQQYTAVVANLK